MPKSPLSVVIPCRNEQENILSCIASIREIADEIVVADSGSTDDTLQRVRRNTDCRIVCTEPPTNMGALKNWAIDEASHEWVFLIDADERATRDLRMEISRLWQKGPTRDGYWIPRQNHFLGHKIRFSGWATDGSVRLFRRDRGRYSMNRIHEEFVISSGRVGRLKSVLKHYTYWTYDDYLQKFNRYTSRLAQDAFDRQRRPSLCGLLFRGPWRFLHAYVFRLGFLDGLAGLQVCATTGFYSFMKQARLWEMYYARTREECDAGEAE